MPLTVLWHINHNMIRAVAFFGFLTIDHRVVKAADMPRCFPAFRVLDNRAVHADNLDGRAIGAYWRTSDHVFPPAVAQIVL